MSFNYENSYALNNSCTPCQLFVDNKMGPRFSASANASGSHLYGDAQSMGSMPTASYAQSSSHHYVDPSVARQGRVISAINQSRSMDSAVTAKENQRLAGYTGGVRVSMNASY